jgi:hypothetical protein
MEGVCGRRLSGCWGNGQLHESSKGRGVRKRCHAHLWFRTSASGSIGMGSRPTKISRIRWRVGNDITSFNSWCAPIRTA